MKPGSRSFLLAVVVPFALTACSSAPPAAPGKPDAVVEAPASKGEADQRVDREKKVEERATKEKELRNKKRELDYARLGLETAAIDRQVRSLVVEVGLSRARLDLDKAKKELDLFLTAHKPREVEEHKITIDAQTYRAEEAKDEQAELESMYKDDEFAKKTKELVLKRGKRQVELADRGLAVAKKEQEVFEQHTLPDRERDLRRKVDDGETEVKKTELEQRKAALELDVQKRQAEDKVHDLELDVKELEQKLAKESQ